MPRSLAYCYQQILRHLLSLEAVYNVSFSSLKQARQKFSTMQKQDIQEIFEFGLHEYIIDFIADNNALSTQIARDFHLT